MGFSPRDQERPPALKGIALSTPYAALKGRSSTLPPAAQHREWPSWAGFCGQVITGVSDQEWKSGALAPRYDEALEEWGFSPGRSKATPALKGLVLAGLNAALKGRSSTLLPATHLNMADLIRCAPGAA